MVHPGWTRTDFCYFGNYATYSRNLAANKPLSLTQKLPRTRVLSLSQHRMQRICRSIQTKQPKSHLLHAPPPPSVTNSLSSRALPRRFICCLAAFARTTIGYETFLHGYNAALIRSGFAFATGPLAWSVWIFRNSFVFHQVVLSPSPAQPSPL